MPSPLNHVDKYLREMMDIRRNSGQHKCHISCRQKKGSLCPRPVPHAWPQWAHKRARTRTTENPPPVGIATKILFTKIEQVNPNKIALPYPIFCMQTNLPSVESNANSHAHLRYFGKTWADRYLKRLLQTRGTGSRSVHHLLVVRPGALATFSGKRLMGFETGILDCARVLGRSRYGAQTMARFPAFCQP